MSIFEHKTFCLITGASRGLGAEITRSFSTLFPKGSFLVLTARSTEGLQATRDTIKQLNPPSEVQTCITAVNLSGQTIHTFTQLLDSVMTENSLSTRDFEQAIIIHNAGTIGDISKAVVELSDARHLQEFWDVNLTSCILLNTAFFCRFKDVHHKLVIAITSICSILPFKSWSLYCGAKAARDMIFRTLAEEEPSIRVLNYAPGPLDTDMQLRARTESGDEDVKRRFKEMKEEGKLLTCQQSVSKLIQLLQTNAFTSGSHIDYYDEL